jgi:hypothetical protein
LDALGARCEEIIALLEIIARVGWVDKPSYIYLEKLPISNKNRESVYLG